LHAVGFGYYYYLKPGISFTGWLNAYYTLKQKCALEYIDNGLFQIAALWLEYFFTFF